MHSLFWKIFLTLWLTIVGFSAAIGWLNDKLAREQWAEQPLDSFERGMFRIGQRAQQAAQIDGRKGLRDELLNIPRMTRGHIYVEGPEGREVLGRDAALTELVERRTPMETTEFADRQGDRYTMYTVSPAPPSTILAPGPEGTALRLLAAALISAAISYLLARSLANPLESLRAASRRIAAGDLATRVDEKARARQDEIGQLAEDFDTMAARLEAMQLANRRLLQDVSHELRSPLARLSVAVEIARQKGTGPIAPEIDRIELEGQRLETLVNDVLGLLRVSSDANSPFDEDIELRDLLNDLVEVVNYEAPDNKPGIDWNPGESCLFYGNREQIWRAVENLLRNALRHTDPERGAILTLERGKKSSPTRISVRDFGPGVPKAELEKIFEPFYRVQESRDRGSGGHGLGLSIAANAVRRHGGTIEARNAPDGGLIVELTLPASAVS